MNKLRFALAAACLGLLPQPAVAQMGLGAGYEFIKAVRDRDGAKAHDLIDSNPPGILNSRDGDGSTPLMIAVSREDPLWTGFLITRGADVNLAGKGGDTPLIAAARVGFTEAVDWLLEAKAKVDASNRMGETALIIAVQQRDAVLVKRLLAARADPDKTDSAAGLSARDYAQRDTRSRQILQLIEARKPKPVTAAATSR